MNPNPDTSRKRRLLLLVVLVALILLIGGILLYRHNQSQQQQKSLLDQQQAAFAKTATADPILKYLPYGSLTYNITPTFKQINGARTLVLEVSVILSGADYNQSPQDIQDTINTDQQAALSYIKSKGFDPSKYKIDYIVPAH